jgi:WD40 repeat protein
MEVGSVEAWAFGEESSKFVKMWSKGYPKEAITLSLDKASNRVLVGLDDGVIDVIQVTNNGYEDVACVKAHQNRVTGVVYDAMSNVIYSVSMDKVLRVSHGSSISLIVGVPHKEPIFSMIRDTLNKRIMFGTKTGEIYIYDISQAEKPKILTVLQNNKKGSIRCIYLDTNRNYLFTGSYDDGELNVFDLDKPGREKYAKDDCHT